VAAQTLANVLNRVVVDPGGCWIWTGRLGRDGYGYVDAYDRQHTAHRYLYAQMIGPLPQELHLDHLCRVRCCVNPDHVEPVTPKENIRRGDGWAGRHARQTHCVHGHPLDGDNLFVRPDGERVCRTCSRNRQTLYRARKAA
jgi:hypothetical protein